MEDLQSVALSILNTSHFRMGYKISKLEEFKIDAEDELNNCKNERTKKDLKNYIEWLDRQLAVLRNNGTYICNKGFDNVSRRFEKIKTFPKGTLQKIQY